MHSGGSHVANAAVAVLVVVPGKEGLGPSPGIRQAAEALWIIRPVFHRLELGFGEWIIVRDVRARVTLDHTEIGHQECDRLGQHRPAAVGMDRELVRPDVLFGRLR